MSADSEKSYYEILGVDRLATKDEIQEAFHTLARLLHPDSQYYADIVDSAPTPEQVELFKKVTNAYHTLIDDDKRAAYDARYLKQTMLYEDTADEEAIAAKLAELGLGDDVAKIAGVRLNRPKKKKPALEASSERLQSKARPPQEKLQTQPAQNAWSIPKGTSVGGRGGANSNEPPPTRPNPKKIRSW